MQLLHQAWAITVRHFRQYFGDTNILLQTLFWPLLDALIWGFLGIWVQQLQHAESNMQLSVMVGIFLSRAYSSSCGLMGVTLYEELTSNNLINIFASPLRLKSWFMGTVMFSVSVAACVHVLYITPLIWVMHGGTYMFALKVLLLLLIFVPPIIVSGLFLGIIVLTALFTFGKRANELIYVIVWSMMPFTTAYYPLEVLPMWGQMLSKCLPFVHIFQAMREYVLHYANPTMGILKGVSLGLCYGAISICIFYRAFKRSKIKGLARLSD